MHKKNQLGTHDMSSPVFGRTHINIGFIQYRDTLNSPIQTTGLDYSKCAQLSFFVKRFGRCKQAWLIVGLCLVCATQGQTQAPTDANAASALVGDVWGGSRSPAVHRLVLYDDQGFRIFPGVNFDQPFSTTVTCGQCHQIDTVAKGWHFTAGRDPNVPGRPGEPWIFWDCPTGTQIPLSYRRWPGTFDPNQVGLTDWWFVRVFGRQMPGGGVGVPDPTVPPNPLDHWPVSGKLEINCLSCHDTEPTHDQAQFGQQIRQHNYRWAATATSGVALVDGSAKDLPESWRKGDPGQGPSVAYDPSRFLADNKVLMPIRRAAPDERCLFCHSTRAADETSDDRTIDVHLAAGLRCVDCHRNGLDHSISRGYETEAKDVNDPRRQALSCKGCHLDKDAKGMGTTRLAAPYPVHKGIPVIHFEKLACTACHSGPQPGDRAVMARTSRAHGLGTHRDNVSFQTLPHVQMPVFAKGPDGKIAPHKGIWPAYWGQRTEGRITPIALDLVKKVAGPILPHEQQLATPSWPRLSPAQVQEVLAALTQSGVTNAVYVSGGKVHQVKDGSLVAQDDEAARPYLWSMAHDVRPARQALGSKACQDCHSMKAGFLFGRVAMDGPLADPNASVGMVEFERLEPRYTTLFAWTFVFRPYLKIVALAACALIAGVVVAFVLRALYAVSRSAAELDSSEERKT